METPTRKTPGIRARELYESGTIDGAQYEAIVSADRRFQKEEARWQAEVEAHYGAAPPAADWTLCGGGTVDAAYPPGPPPLMVPVAVQENAYDRLHITRDLYGILKDKARAAMRRAEREAPDDDGDEGARKSVAFHGREKSLELLALDVPRTLARFGNQNAGSPGELGDALTEVLRAYVLHRPDVGYVQGMSYLAAVLVLALKGDPFDAFVALANMLQRPFFFDFYRLDSRDVKARVGVFDDVFDAARPALRRRFAGLGLDSGVFLLDWALTLFASVLEGGVLHHVWECFLIGGPPFFVRCALAILAVLEPELLAAPEIPDVLDVLRKRPGRIDDATLFRAVARVAESPEAHAALLAGRREKPRPPGAPPAPAPCRFGCAPMPKAVHWEELTEVGAALSPRTRRPTDRFYQREAPRPKGDDLEGDDLAPPPEGEDLPPADEGEDSAAEEFDRKSAPRFSRAAARLQEALEVAQAESSLAAPPGRWFEPGQEARKILLGTRVRGIEYEGAHLNVDALSRARVLVLEEEAAISSTVDDPLRLNDARLQPGILCEKYDWTKIDDESDVAIVVECTGAVDFFLLALSVSGSVSSATRCKGASLQTADFRAAKLIAKLNHFSLHQEMSSSLPETISWPGGQDAARELADGALCFAILDAGVLLDVGESAKGSGRVCIIPGDTRHATLRCLDDSGRYHKVVGTSLLSKNNLLPAEDD
ncbi:hypothetical protein JL721_2588 [Aureococcus anophagefferens]|nr:hypothetical protein JL721_2588 [Aureococcus anophagefferens]